MRPKLGDWFYKISNNRLSRHKINFMGKETYEWGKAGKTSCGWGTISELIRNPNKKSNIKWIKDEDVER